MLIRKTIKDPYSWHPYFVWTPVKFFVTTNDKKFIVEAWAWLTTLERKLERNLSGTMQWQYRIR